MSIKRRKFLKTSATAAAAVGVGSLVGKRVFPARAQQTPPYKKTFFAPDPPPYPKFTDRNAIINEARRISDALEAYIKDWLDGKVPAQIPENLLPVGYNNTLFKNFYLQRPEEVTPEQQWGTRLAEKIDFTSTRPSFNDPNCTYLVLPIMYAPFGSTVIMEGEFPHARFFDIQPSPSFHPEAYRYDGTIGVGEVPIVDADIEPLPGHTNPFRVGADRNATRRRYRVEFNLKIGNPAEIEQAFRPPTYRAPGNNRAAGAIFYQGPWGDPKALPWGHGRGLWDFGQIWVRYYAPDQAVGPLGGVPLPKVYYQLPDGRQFYVNADKSAWTANINRRKPAKSTEPQDPNKFNGATVGWDKQVGIFRAVYTGIAVESGLADQAYVRLMDKGVAGRGEDVPPPGNFEAYASNCTYINYLARGMSLNSQKVCVLTGKLPTFPRTRNGEPVMEAASRVTGPLLATMRACPTPMASLPVRYSR